ncbi:MAG: lysophospholipase [Polaromonas sp.]
MELANLAPFTASDGENLALYEWRHADGSGHDLEHHLSTCTTGTRGVVLIVHGLGEHAGRYAHVARQLMAWGFVVRAYDQRGHGESGGARGALPTEDALLDDLADVVDLFRSRSRAFVEAAEARGVPMAMPPLILLGHSLGGLVASRLVALNRRRIDGLVLTSPALRVAMGTLQKLALAAAHRVAPTLVVPNGLDVAGLSHDPAVIRQYLADPLVHNRISARLGLFIQHNGPPTIEAADHWRTPTLLMYAGADRLVDPQGSREFAARARGPTVRPGMVTARCFEGLYHELFNELDAQVVFDTLRGWLDARFP